MDIFEWVENWYLSMCDGEWEHYYGVKIDTLDNPGWIVQIDIMDTGLENKPFYTINRNIEDDNWIYCQLRDGKYEGLGDPTKLREILEIFKKWVENF